MDPNAHVCFTPKAYHSLVFEYYKTLEYIISDHV